MTTDDTRAPLDWKRVFESSDNPDFINRSAAFKILSDFDYEAQLDAIRYTLREIREKAEEFQREIADFNKRIHGTSGLSSMVAESDRTDRLYTSVFQDATSSMAAVGMLAPMFESVFCQAFQGIRQNFFSDAKPPTNHARWHKPSKNQWDCHFVLLKSTRKKHLAKGIMELSEAVGLAPYLPRDLHQTLQALFEYRNKMFHCGFEWPLDERQKFEKRIAKEKYHDIWFSNASISGKPWVFYMTDDFIQHCLDMLDMIISGIGAYCRIQSEAGNSTGDANT